jgi:urea transport system permease protein
MMSRLSFWCAALLFALGTSAHALDTAQVARLVSGDSDEKSAAISALVVSGDPAAAILLQAFADGDVQVSGERAFITASGRIVDAATGETLTELPPDHEDPVINNRLRRELGEALAVLKLISPDRLARLTAARALASGPDQSMLPLVSRALASEQDAEVRALLMVIEAAMQVNADDRAVRLRAIATLGESGGPNARKLLLPIVARTADGSFVETDADIRAAAERSLRAIDGRLAWGERIGLVFAGISLGSILLLAALGLAITYGLMGVINMAHGELMMIGAYATFVVQAFFRSHMTEWFDWYPLVAVPVAFAVAAGVGMALERLVIRHLYGRPLETLLATWGISLFLIQCVRTIFGAQNVQVENPAFMSGGVAALSNLVLPWNRIVIIVFSLAVLALVSLLLNRTRLGLFVRGVTQNRTMASCVGVATARVDTWAFGLGSGIAGLAGCGLSQIGNVGPELGQGYIVDSFMVVVLGGVGQLIGTVYAALGLGFANKLLEAWSGAVLAKIAVLVFIIVFIQRRPQGMFALKGRSTD